MRSVFVLLVCVCLAACGSSNNNDPAPEALFELVYERERDVDPDAIDHAKVAQLRTANTEMAFRFYRELRTADPGLVFSPLSVSRVFAGYYDGQREAAAFEALFGFTPEVATIDTWKQLMHLATDRSEFSMVNPDERSSFEATDIYWVDEDGGGTGNLEAFDRVHELPIQEDPAAATEIINQWVEDTSGGLLVDFLQSGQLTEETTAVATNLVYFLGAWTYTYEERTVEFDGKEVPAFGGEQELRAAVTDDGVTVLNLPYAHGYHHVILMPNDDFEGFVEGLDGARFAELNGSANGYMVTLTVPEFSVSSRPPVAAAIGTLRVATGTDGDTLSGAYGESYVHVAAMEFSKEGTRAAAASAVIEYENGDPGPPEPLTVVIDKPFVHAVIDGRTQSILFLGEVTEL